MRDNSINWYAPGEVKISKLPGRSRSLEAKESRMGKDKEKPQAC